jgi:hypothetical protein
VANSEMATSKPSTIDVTIDDDDLILINFIDAELEIIAGTDLNAAAHSTPAEELEDLNCEEAGAHTLRRRRLLAASTPTSVEKRLDDDISINNIDNDETVNNFFEGKIVYLEGFHPKYHPSLITGRWLGIKYCQKNVIIIKFI